MKRGKKSRRSDNPSRSGCIAKEAEDVHHGRSRMRKMSARIDRHGAIRVAQATVVLVLTVSYLSSVFQFFDPAARASGLGDWGDPYFINYLLEHWHHSVWNLQDPTSPPMYFPVKGTLGYSHALILYAPFYLAVRVFLAPFQAYTLALFLVLASGTLSLYAILRRWVGLAFIESLLLTAFFCSSRNVINVKTGIWSQTASVFLIPSILVIALGSARQSDSRPRLVLAGLTGLLSTLLFAQEFYTGLFALFFATFILGVALLVERRRSIIGSIRRFWTSEHRLGAKAAILMAAIAGLWMLGVWASGGGAIQILGIKIASHDWRRPAVLAVAALAVFIYIRGGIRFRVSSTRVRTWTLGFAAGAGIGTLVFLRVYFGAFLEHHAFPESQLMNSLTATDPSRWHSPVDFVRALGDYDSFRSFKLTFIVGCAAWVPWLQVHRKVRLYCLWFLLLSLIVLAVPIRFGDFSLWKTFFAPLPGFSVIRDPKRIIHVYEVVFALSTALFLTALPKKSLLRISVTALLFFFLVTDWNREVFTFKRPIGEYRQWVEAPIEIDAACQSFFIRPASDRYMARWDNQWMLYGVDSMFVAVTRSIPTLNGYSAWFPDGWELTSPREPGYFDAVRRWIDRHQLEGVCELDIEKRTMSPYGPRGSGH